MSCRHIENSVYNFYNHFALLLYTDVGDKNIVLSLISCYLLIDLNFNDIL